MFVATKVSYQNIDNGLSLKSHLGSLEKRFSNSNYSNKHYLDVLDCLQPEVLDVCGVCAEMYDFNKRDAEESLSRNLKWLSGDYSLSPKGTIIAIVHAEEKTAYRFDFEDWRYHLR